MPAPAAGADLPPALARGLLLNAAGLTSRRLAELGATASAVVPDPAGLPLLGTEMERVTRIRASGFLEKESALARRHGVHLIGLGDARYPELLARIQDPPLVLYVQGDPVWLGRQSVGIVGSRNATMYGRTVAESLSTRLALAGLTIVSGFARGVDAAAHRAALRAGGGTVAALGCGLLVDYPKGHAQLRADIAKHGCLVSEYPLETTPRKDTFPRRNRIISGLTLGVIVVEARETSGALITARLAMEQGREVFAVPGNVFSPQSRGPHALLRDGAGLVEGADDVLAGLGGKFTPRILASEGPVPAPGTVEASVWEALTPEPVQAEDLAAKLALPISQLLATLAVLELKGCARQSAGKRFARA